MHALSTIVFLGNEFKNNVMWEAWCVLKQPMAEKQLKGPEQYGCF